jgi:serine/threonine protein kinase
MFVVLLDIDVSTPSLPPSLEFTGPLLHGSSTSDAVTVRLAYDRSTNRKVCVKSGRKNNMLANECQYLQRFNSPHVVSWMREIEADGCQYIVMAYCNQGDMCDLLMNRQEPTAGTSITFDTKRAWFKQMAQSVQVVHAESVAHMDISFENFLLHNNKVKLCDFGCSRPCVSNTSVDIMGKQPYIAPEIRHPNLQSGMYDARSCDIYSLGVCLFYLLTGRMPYVGGSGKCARTARNYLRTEGVRSLLIVYGFKILGSHECVIQLLENMLCECTSRINIDDVLAHPWVVQTKSVQV